MESEWDPRKAKANLKKHGVDFADAATILHDDQAFTIRDESSDEERYVTIGVDALGRLLVVVYTWRGGNASGSFPRRRQLAARLNGIKVVNEERI